MIEMTQRRTKYTVGKSRNEKESIPGWKLVREDPIHLVWNNTKFPDIKLQMYLEYKKEQDMWVLSGASIFASDVVKKFRKRQEAINFTMDWLEKWEDRAR